MDQSLLSVGLLPANLLLYSRVAYNGTGEGNNNLVASLNFGTLFISLEIAMGAAMTGLLASSRHKWSRKGYEDGTTCTPGRAGTGHLLLADGRYLCGPLARKQLVRVALLRVRVSTSIRTKVREARVTVILAVGNHTGDSSLEKEGRGEGFYLTACYMTRVRRAL